MLQQTQPLASVIIPSSTSCDQFRVHIDRTEIIDEHPDPTAMFSGQNVVEQRRLARARKPATIVTGIGESSISFI